MDLSRMSAKYATWDGLQSAWTEGPRCVGPSTTHRLNFCKANNIVWRSTYGA